jgi:hypothetical protein
VRAATAPSLPRSVVTRLSSPSLAGTSRMPALWPNSPATEQPARTLLPSGAVCSQFIQWCSGALGC